MRRTSGWVGLFTMMGLAGCAQSSDGGWHSSALVDHKAYSGAIMTSSSLPPTGLPAHDPLDIAVR